MSSQKVCLVTGAASKIGQQVVLKLVSNGKKVLALGDVEDIFSPDVLKTHKIKVNTLLPVTNKSFQKHDVQFCFGDLSDISFLASIFSSADTNNIEIEHVIHLSANKEIQKTSPHAYHPDFGDTVNLLEVTRAYWQAHPKVFKSFFFASDKSNKVNDKIVKMMQKISDKEGFPINIYNSNPISSIGSDYKGKTEVSSLYRLVTPLKILSNFKKNDDRAPSVNSKEYLMLLLIAITNSIKEN